MKVPGQEAMNFKFVIFFISLNNAVLNKFHNELLTILIENAIDMKWIEVTVKLSVTSSNHDVAK